jgi:hypothetical protein
MVMEREIKMVVVKSEYGIFSRKLDADIWIVFLFWSQYVDPNSTKPSKNVCYSH